MKNLLIWILVIVLSVVFSVINACVIPNSSSWSYILGMTYMLVSAILFELKE